MGRTQAPVGAAAWGCTLAPGGAAGGFGAANPGRGWGVPLCLPVLQVFPAC